MALHRRAIPMLLYWSASIACAGINSPQRQGQGSLHFILSSYSVLGQNEGGERGCAKCKHFRAFPVTFERGWKRQGVTVLKVGVYTPAQVTKRRRWQSTKWAAKKINQSKQGQVNLRADLSFFVILKRAKSVFKTMRQIEIWTQVGRFCSCCWVGIPPYHFWQKKNVAI